MEAPQKALGGLCLLTSAKAFKPGEFSMELIINSHWHWLPEAKFQRETERPNEHVAGDHSSADTFLGTNCAPCYGSLRLSN